LSSYRKKPQICVKTPTLQAGENAIGSKIASITDFGTGSQNNLFLLKAGILSM
jgi:hypothetical protein